MKIKLKHRTTQAPPIYEDLKTTGIKINDTHAERAFRSTFLSRKICTEEMPLP